MSVPDTGELFGPYRLVRRIGQGGMGEVHEAWDTVRHRPVALKRLRADTDDARVRERFRRESTIAARLGSPHVVPIHDFGLIDGALFIDMRLVRGLDLGELLDREGPLDPARAVAILGQVADALDSAHSAGLVHRDVKPSNVLLSSHRGRDFAYLADFGIVHVREATASDRLTGTGTAMGTPAYMAPEQMQATEFDHRLDVYALGCVLFRMLTGRPPFVGETVAVLYDHVHTPPPAPSTLASLPPGFDAVVLRALAKDPALRHASAGDLADAAAQVVDPASRPVTADDALTGAGDSPAGVDAVTTATRPPVPGAVPLRRRPSTPPTSLPPHASRHPSLPPSAPFPSLSSPTAPPARRSFPAPAVPLDVAPAPHSPKEAGAEPASSEAASPARSEPDVASRRALVLAALVPPAGVVAGVIALRRARPAGGRPTLVAAGAIGIGLALLVLAVVLVVGVVDRRTEVPGPELAVRVAEQTGLAPKQVSCADPLPAEDGASTVCTATAGATTQRLRVTVSAVQGDGVLFDVAPQ